DIIISGGDNISTIEVEQAIARHPDVLEVAVIAVPDANWGEVPKAFVVLKEGRTPTEADIIAHCRTVLAHFKCPRAVAFGPLPKTSTGKVQKYAQLDVAVGVHDGHVAGVEPAAAEGLGGWFHSGDVA